MQKIFNKIIILVFFLITACADTLDNVKKGLGGGKRVTTDEFLVKKKNPLTMPPKWDALPIPGQNMNLNEALEEVTDIEELIQVSKNQNSSINFEQSGNIEDSFRKKINKK